MHVWGFLVITALFAAGELLLIHVPTRRDTHTVSFSEIPLILGLFLLPGAQFAVAAVIGTSLALRFHRKQRGVKLAFNIAEIGVQPVLAILVFRTLADHSQLASPRAFAAAIAAALAADLMSALLVSLAIGLFRGTWPELGAFELIEGALASVAKAALALLAVSAVLYNSAAALTMAAVCATTMYLAFWAYALLHERHQRLDMLYRFTSAVGGSVQLEAIAETVVKEARDLFRTARRTVRGDASRHDDRLGMPTSTAPSHESGWGPSQTTRCGSASWKTRRGSPTTTISPSPSRCTRVAAAISR